jgi:hypothetical protein
MNNSILFVLIAALHLVLNWSVLVRYIKNKAVAGLNLKKELAAAMLIGGLCIAGPIYNAPPFSSVVAVNDDIKNYWEERASQAPVAHAEDLTLAELADRIGLPPEDVSKSLKAEGFETVGLTLTVAQVGERKGVAPKDVFAAIQKHHPHVAVESRGGPGQGRGRGNGRRWSQASSRETGCGGETARSSDECPQSDAPAADGAMGCGGGDEGHGPGFGRGQGRGMGMGRGPGMGMGRGAGMGMGMGRGRGMGRGQEANHEPPSGEGADQGKSPAER